MCIFNAAAMFPAQSCSVAPGLGCALSSATCREVAAMGGAGSATVTAGVK